MNSLVATEIKKTGATFTPHALAYFLAQELISYSKIGTNNVVLDPACGDGALLYAIQKSLPSNTLNIIGYDTNASYLQQAERVLRDTKNVTFHQEDFLSVCSGKMDLFSGGSLSEFADIVIANPPYVRTQILGSERAQQLSRLYNLSGRIDLYFPFIIAMTNALKKGGLMGVITSNRYLCTKSGADIRKFLLDHYDILDIIDLGDTKLFDAAVLPAIFIGRKKNSKTAKSMSVGKFRSIYEHPVQEVGIENSTIGSVYDVMKRDVPGVYNVGGKIYDYKSGLLKHAMDKTAIWQMSTEDENEWIDTVNSNTSFRIGDRFKVRVGIKSCADKIFINGLWNRENIVVEDELLSPLISQENIDTWRIDRSTMPLILYPHYSVDGKRMVYDINRFPQARKFLESHRKELEKREYLLKANRAWYEYWVPQNPALWSLPKVVFPDISLYPRFCYDESGAVVNGNCYWMCATTETERQLLLLVEGVCNSDVMVKYHDLCFNNKLYSGRRRYLSQYIEKYPVPDPNSNIAKEIVIVVDSINKETDPQTRDSYVKCLNDMVRQAFGLRG